MSLALRVVCIIQDQPFLILRLELHIITNQLKKSKGGYHYLSKGLAHIWLGIYTHYLYNIWVRYFDACFDVYFDIRFVVSPLKLEPQKDNQKGDRWSLTLTLEA